MDEEGLFRPLRHLKRARKAASDREGFTAKRETVAEAIKPLLPNRPLKRGEHKAVCDRINEAQIRTSNGREWTPPNLKAFLKAAGLAQAGHDKGV